MYLKVIDETTRAKTAKLTTATLYSGQDSEECFMKVIITREEIQVGEAMTHRRVRHIFVQEVSPEYESIRL